MHIHLTYTRAGKRCEPWLLLTVSLAINVSFLHNQNSIRVVETHLYSGFCTLRSRGSCALLLGEHELLIRH